mgnify:CR=1 FL=1
MADPVFIAVAVLTVGTAIMALEARELIYGAIALAISMLGIAGFFLLLDAPFVAMFHGGPEGQERPGFSPTYQALLSRGIGVFAPNVRGSSGFGKRFVNLDNGALRFNGVKDIKSSVDFLVSRGIADPRRIGEAGTPAIRVIDLNRHAVRQGLSTPLLAAMDQHLGRGNPQSNGSYDVQKAIDLYLPVRDA